MKEELISVIVPVYNVEQYLDRCISSIVNQTYKNLEIILIDDGSPDSCPKLCDEWAQKDKRIKVIHKRNGGLMAAWIDGVKASTGNYISFVDSDDWCELNMIEELYKPFVEFDVDLTICDYNRAKDASKKVEPGVKMEISTLLQNEELENIKKYKERFLTSYRWNKLFKKESILNNLKYCDTRIGLCEDVCISVACVLDSKKIYYVRKALYSYYDRSDSMVNIFKPNMLSNFEIFYPMLEKTISEKGYGTTINLATENITCLYVSVKNIMLSKVKNKRKLFKDSFNSYLYKNLKKFDLKQVKSKIHKIFLKVYQTKSYFLTRFMIFSWQVICKIKKGFKKR